MTTSTLISVVLVSLVSLVGLVFLAHKDKAEGAAFQRWILILIALSIGALSGDVALHLLPEAVSEIGLQSWYTATAGVFVFFLLDRILHWRHRHPTTTARIEPRGIMNLIADGIHNFVDGALIAASYLVSPVVGLATTLAVILHEIPQELGDYGILRDAGFKPKQALVANLLSAILAIIGALVVLFTPLADYFPEAQIISFTAGGFVYIIYLLIQRLLESWTSKRTLAYIAAVLIGLLAMYGLTFMEFSAPAVISTFSR